MLKEEHKKLIDEVIYMINNSSNDWFFIKKIIVNHFSPKQRKNFSRRHYSTKKHILNSFDKEVIKYWQIKTGTILIIDKNKLHDDSWEQKPKGWALKKINEERRSNTKKNYS
jgi:hypothetical protein